MLAIDLATPTRLLLGYLPSPDNIIKVTYYTLVPPASGQLYIPTPVAWGGLRVGVGPVVQFFTINNSPIPPNPEVPERFDARVVFINGRDIMDGFRTERVNAQGEHQQRAVVFDAQVFKGAIQDGDIQFIQNLQVRNGDGAGRHNAFTFRRDEKLFKGVQVKNKSFVFVDQAGKILARPVLDGASNNQPHPWYESTKVPIVGNAQAYIQITASDQPAFPLEAVIHHELFNGLEKLFFDPRVPEEFSDKAKQDVWSLLENFDYSADFAMFLVWVTKAGAGPLAAPTSETARTLYTLAVRPWQMRVGLHKGPGSRIINSLGNSPVTYPGDFILAGDRNPIIIGSWANEATRLQPMQ